MRDKLAWVLIAGLVALRLGLLIFMLGRLPEDPSGHWLANDAVRYRTIAATPGTPYVDHDVEVPPVEWIALEAVAAPDAAGTAKAVGWFMFASDMVVVVALVFGWKRNAALAYLLIAMPLVPFIYFRLDLLSVAVTVAGMALVTKKAPVAGGIALGVAVMTKFWPVVLAPVLVAKRTWKALIVWAAATAASLAAWIAWVGVEGPRQVASFRGASGWQIESGVGSILLRFSKMAVLWDADANRIGTVSPLSRAILSVLLVAGLATASYLAAGCHDAGVTGVTGVTALAGVALLLLLAPILSWQYLIWLAPWAALAWIQGDRSAAVAATVGIAFTAPLVFLGVELTERQAAATWILLARNSALGALVITCFVSLARRNSKRWETGSDEPEPTGV